MLGRMKEINESVVYFYIQWVLEFFQQIAYFWMLGLQNFKPKMPFILYTTCCGDRLNISNVIV